VSSRVRRRTLLVGAAGLGAAAVAVGAGPGRQWWEHHAVDAGEAEGPEPSVTTALREPTTVPTPSPASPAPSPSGSPSPSPSPTASASPSPSAPAASTGALRSYLARRPGEAAVAAVDLDTRTSLAYRSRTGFITASIVKVDILAALLLRAQNRGRRLTATEADLARDMIIESDNDAATSLWHTIGGGSGLTAANRAFGLTDTTPWGGDYWGDTRTTARDQLRLLGVLTSASSPLGRAYRAVALDLMQDVQPDQRWGVSAAAAGGTTALKNGWLATVTGFASDLADPALGRVPAHRPPVVIALPGVVNTLALSAQERTRELGASARRRHDPVPCPQLGAPGGRDHRVGRCRRRPRAGDRPCPACVRPRRGRIGSSGREGFGVG
jgi:hypothetical protein